MLLTAPAAVQIPLWPDPYAHPGKYPGVQVIMARLKVPLAQWQVS